MTLPQWPNSRMWNPQVRSIVKKKEERSEECDSLFSCIHLSSRNGKITDSEHPSHQQHGHEKQKKIRHYQCTDCEKTFKKKRNLQSHRRVHKNNRPHKCVKCRKEFLRKWSLDNHLSIHLIEGPYQCTDCNRTFTERKNLLRHRDIHNRPHTCEQCGKGFRRKKELVSHVATHSTDRLHKCTDCNKTFTERKKLLYHRDSHNDSRPHTCEQCGKGFRRKDKLVIHLVTHSTDRPYKCTDCDKTFKSMASLQQHRRVHRSNRPYKCEKCGRGFLRKWLLDNHLLSHLTEGPYQCTDCCRTFTERKRLRRHRDSHDDMRPHLCVQCGQGFRYKCTLEVHLTTTHSTERPYKCTDCGMAFKSKRALVGHRITHSETMPYKCSCCTKQFRRKRSLQYHVRKHIREKTWIPNPHSKEQLHCCELCEKVVSSRLALVRHMCRSHSDLNKLECEECGKKFRLDKHLDSHRLVHAGEKQHKCKHCDKSFTHRNGLKLHRNEKHPAMRTGNKRASSVNRKRAPIVRHVHYALLSTCEVCGKTVTTEYLKQHLEIHKRPHKCSECQECFKDEAALTRHARWHQPTAHQCQYCKRYFAARSLLAHHLPAVHTQERRHTCNKCGATFKWEHGLNHHLKIHKNPRIPCRLCPTKKFATAMALNRHFYRHTREMCNMCLHCRELFTSRLALVKHLRRVHRHFREHVCRECGKIFRHLNHLNRHYYVHTGERRHKCQHCGKGFTHVIGVILHLRAKHPQEPTETTAGSKVDSEKTMEKIRTSLRV